MVDVVEFDRVAFEGWLEKQSNDVVSLIGIRMALRTMLRLRPAELAEKNAEALFWKCHQLMISAQLVLLGKLNREDPAFQNAYDEISGDVSLPFVHKLEHAESIGLAVSCIEHSVEAVVSDEVTDIFRAVQKILELLFQFPDGSAVFTNALTADFEVFSQGDHSLTQQIDLPLLPAGKLGRDALAVEFELDAIASQGSSYERWSAWYKQVLEGQKTSWKEEQKLCDIVRVQYEKEGRFDVKQAFIQVYLKTATLLDDDKPTSIDRLNRKSFTSVLALHWDKLFRREQVGDNSSEEQGGQSQGYATLLHAPWGKGKTSLWNFLKEDLKRGELSYAVDGTFEKTQKWVTVEFNAWDHEHREKPWWPFLQCVYSELSEGYSAQWKMLKDLNIWDIWVGWKIRYPWFPVLFVLFSGIALAGYYWAFFELSAQNFGSYLGSIQALLLSAGALYLLGRGIAFGTKKIADFHDDLSNSQMAHLGELFRSITHPREQPICIFIDDLDRCNAEYVVQFLEGIQTHFRASNVFYVVAADRKWLRSAFEQHYSGFKADLSNKGEHPLGLLFLEKIFQLSVGVPDASDAALDAYWKHLLDDKSDGKISAESREGTEPTETAAHGNYNEEGTSFNKKGTDALSNQRRQTAEVVEQVASGRADKEAKHLLSQLSAVLPNNPRSLKRMINLYSIYLVSRSIVGADQPSLPELTMARWIIFEQRFLELSEALLEEPARVVELVGEKAPPEDGETDIIRRYSRDGEVKNVLGYGKNIEGQVILSHINLLKKFG
ncbi:P-loop NTPase fold protein [Pseudovibrio sp. Tun.PSC04-5.I4]|uniref:KAP family P-loop NTPase fold protein n=1 Tax=Pseudovibrio sp. Tun.PSC04-5.I4 TaxID=1798213 RepID=UPI000882D4D2|nr:P-loop NTPase fold protein [Pseudovibrio sp. Tun.PSC04-5.I4]SDR34814.1 KAP family P-loop domain-containing protein [Pseudovibrio sp. Tun.PSC04-5.I4]